MWWVGGSGGRAQAAIPPPAPPVTVSRGLALTLTGPLPGHVVITCLQVRPVLQQL